MGEVTISKIEKGKLKGKYRIDYIDGEWEVALGLSRSEGCKFKKKFTNKDYMYIARKYKWK